MQLVTAVHAVTIVAALLDAFLPVTLWLGAGANCANELVFLETQALLFRFSTSLLDLEIFAFVRGILFVILARSRVAVYSRRNRIVVATCVLVSFGYGAAKLALLLKTVGMYCGISGLQIASAVMSIALPAVYASLLYILYQLIMRDVERHSLLSSVQDEESIRKILTAPSGKPAEGLLRVLSLAKTQWQPLAIGSVGMLVSAATTVATPIFFGIVVDSIVESRSSTQLVRNVLILAAVLSAGSVANFLRAWMFELAGQRLVAKLRKDLFRAITMQDVSFFDVTRTGELTNRLASDTAVLQSAATVDVSMTLRYIVQIIGSVVVLFSLSWSLTLVMLSIVPVVAVGAVAYGRFLKRLKRAFQDALAESNAFASECISNIRTVRAFAQERRSYTGFDRFIDRSLRIGSKQALSLGLFNGGLGFVAQAALALVLWYGGVQVLSGRMSAGTLISFLFQTLSVAMAFAFLSSVYGDFMSAVGASERVFALIDRVPAIPVSGGLPCVHVRGRLELRGIKFTYPTRADAEVLHGIDLTLEPGRVLAVIGPSGGGKSTIAALIERFYDPTDGLVLLDGVDIREFDPQSYRRNIGLVSQEPVLFAATIAENIAYGVESATQERIEEAARQANAHHFITSFPEGYNTMVGERGVRLSGGQKQRIAIARALLLDPRVLLLDEATSALDAESEHLVQEAIDRLMVGRAVLVIAHRLSTVRSAHCVAVIQGGVVAQRGTHEELMAVKGPYRRLVKRQLR